MLQSTDNSFPIVAASEPCVSEGGGEGGRRESEGCVCMCEGRGVCVCVIEGERGV